MEVLESRVRLVWFAGVVVVAALAGVAVVAIDAVLGPVGRWIGPVVVGVLLVAGAAYVLYRYRAWRFELRDDALYIERGVVTRVKTVVPFVRVQHVDSQRGPVDRVAGLATVVVYTAGSRGADVAIPGLTPERADALQERLRRLAIESEHEDAV